MGVKLFQQHQKAGCFCWFYPCEHAHHNCKQRNSIWKYDQIQHASVVPTFSRVRLFILLLVKYLCCVCADLFHTNPFRSLRCVIQIWGIKHCMVALRYFQRITAVLPLFFPLSLFCGCFVGRLSRGGGGQRGFSALLSCLSAALPALLINY